MRIEKLLFKNINSLSGEWEIDLTDPAYVSGGVFAIIGDTGSGKTTILDAICLALYGETPRVSVTSSSNDVMTRTAGGCFAEVVFSCDKGRFLCHWEQNRARGCADGRLQNIQHWIAPMTGEEKGRPIGRTMSENKAKIIEVTGMSFDEFTRSVMLAQGQFAAFLKAKPDERSPILEKITGTDIYTKISKAVHERAVSEKKKLDQLEESVQSYPVMSAEEMARLKAELSENQKTEVGLASTIKTVSEGLQWYKTMMALEKELADLRKQEQAHQRKVEAFKPKQAELDLALKAVGVDADFSAFDVNRKLRKKLFDDLKSLDEEQIPSKTAAQEGALSAQKQAQEALGQAQQSVEVNTPVFNEVRALDKQIADRKQLVETAKAAVDAAKAECDAAEKNKVNAEKEVAEVSSQIEGLQSWRDEHAADEGLIASFEKIKTQFKGLIGIQASIAEKVKELKTAGDAKAAAVKQQEAAASTLVEKEQAKEKAVQALKIKTDELDTHLAGQSLEKLRSHLEELTEKRHQQELFASFEEHRASLQPGMPCPCCGSTEHPFVSAGVPSADGIDLEIEDVKKKIRKAKNLDDEKKKHEAALNAAMTDFTKAEGEKRLADEKLRPVTENVTRIEKELASFNQKYEQEGKGILESISPFGITEIPEDAKGCIDRLADRLKEWQEKDRVFKQTSSTQDKVANKLEAAKNSLAIQTKVFNDKSNEYIKLENVFKALQSERSEKFGAKDPNKEAKKLADAVKKAETALDQKRSDFQEKDKALEVLISQRKAKAGELEEAGKASLALANQFQSALTKAGFEKEAAYLSARKTLEEREKLAEEAKAIKENGIEIKANLKTRQQALADEQAKRLTDIPQAELQEKQVQLEGERQALLKQQGKIGEKLRVDGENRNKRKDIQGRIDGQSKVYAEWDNLRGLIGHHDGKEFRNFVQSLTFEVVISHANDQLQKMDGRYLLKPANENGLDLMVIDSWQGGVERTIKNLSGGESFIVSLALALGLSEMTGRSDRIDSLFLDEGFGTLDEETLNTAMDSLSDLNREGRLIGIISHVEALKERITTKIEVIKQSDGTSLIQGAGVRSISG